MASSRPLLHRGGHALERGRPAATHECSTRRRVSTRERSTAPVLRLKSVGPGAITPQCRSGWCSAGLRSTVFPHGRHLAVLAASVPDHTTSEHGLRLALASTSLDDLDGSRFAPSASSSPTTVKLGLAEAEGEAGACRPSGRRPRSLLDEAPGVGGNPSPQRPEEPHLDARPARGESSRGLHPSNRFARVLRRHTPVSEPGSVLPLSQPPTSLSAAAPRSRPRAVAAGREVSRDVRRRALWCRCRRRAVCRITRRLLVREAFRNAPAHQLVRPNFLRSLPL